MGPSRAVPFGLTFLLLTAVQGSLEGQQSDRIWGKVHTVSGEVHEGFIRWDRNEGSWADVLDGNKKFSPFRFEDWWDMAHPGDRDRDRVVELGGYRITWDDDEPEFPDSHESGIRFGHVRRLSVGGDDMAILELRSGRFLDLEGGATDVGVELREVLVAPPGADIVALSWEDLEEVEFSQAPPWAGTGDIRLHGTMELQDGTKISGYVAWDLQKILTADTLVGFDSDGDRRNVPFQRIRAIRPAGEGAEITLVSGERIELFDSDDVSDDSDGIVVSDPGLGVVEVDWDEMRGFRFHPLEAGGGWAAMDGGRRLRGTVVTSDDTELTGWIRWDGDEEFTWELLDGYSDGVSFDIELGCIASIHRNTGVAATVEVSPTGVSVERDSVEGASVTLWDGRVFDLAGSNDVDDSNAGVFVIPDESGWSPEDPEALWVMVKWADFRSVRFEGEDVR